MPRISETRPSHSPLSILAEMAVEGASSFIETQRIFLNLAKEENNLLMNGLRERVGNSTPAVAMTDLVRRSLDTLLEMQQAFLTTTSKQTLQLLESVQDGKSYNSSHFTDLAREGMQNFVEAHRKFLDAVTQETIKATGKTEQPRVAKKTELLKLARDAGELFLDAQKKVLDVIGQQMNVNLSAATQAAENLSPRLASVAVMPARAVKAFVESEKAILQSLTAPGRQAKTNGAGKHARSRTVRHEKRA